MTKIYGFNNCPYCNELKDLLETDGVLYTYVDITKEENFKEFEVVVNYSKCEDLPMILVGTTLLLPDTSFKSIPEAAKLVKSLLV